MLQHLQTESGVDWHSQHSLGKMFVITHISKRSATLTPGDQNPISSSSSLSEYWSKIWILAHVFLRYHLHKNGTDNLKTRCLEAVSIHVFAVWCLEISPATRSGVCKEHTLGIYMLPAVQIITHLQSHVQHKNTHLDTHSRALSGLHLMLWFSSVSLSLCSLLSCSQT